MYDEERIAQLIVKQLRNNLSLHEKEELQAWLDESPENREFMETRMQPGQVFAGLRALLEIDDQAIRRQINALCNEQILRTIPESHKKIKLKGTAVRTSIAAALILLLGVGIYFWSISNKKRPDLLALLKGQLKVMGKSADSTRLTLPDGRIIFPDKTTIGKIWEGEGWRVSQVDSQEIAYEDLPAKIIEREKNQPGWISLSLPYGQSWKLSFPDSSRAELSTGSVLSYPMKVAGISTKQRALALNGEAYFEVTSNPQFPFTVITPKGVAAALGTSFNVRDYGREDNFQVTLLTGSIKVSNDKHSRTLKPREKAKIDNLSDSIRVENATDEELTKTLKWRSPFELTDKNIREVMQQLTTWYKMDTTIFGKKVDTISPGSLGIVGHVAKDMPLPILLKQLLRRTNLDFRIENKQIFITQK